MVIQLQVLISIVCKTPHQRSCFFTTTPEDARLVDFSVLCAQTSLYLGYV
jgi:hypothetical protein